MIPIAYISLFLIPPFVYSLAFIILALLDASLTSHNDFSEKRLLVLIFARVSLETKKQAPPLEISIILDLIVR